MGCSGFACKEGAFTVLSVKGELGENEEAAPAATSKFSIRHFRRTPEQSLVYLKELCVARRRSQVAPVSVRRLIM